MKGEKAEIVMHVCYRQVLVSVPVTHRIAEHCHAVVRSGRI